LKRSRSSAGNAVEAGLQREIAFAGPLGDRDHGTRIRKPLVEAVGVAQSQLAAPQRHDRRMRIV
jgi:hypothetical protein